MMVISVPSRLKAATLTLLLSIPLIAIEVVIATRSPIWRLPYRSMGYWAVAFALICIPLSVWLAAGKKWVFPIAVGLAGVWILASAWMAFTIQYPPLGFFTLFLLAFSFVELMWLKIELQRSFFDPQLAWYQGLPKPIPGLMCQLGDDQKVIDLRVSRFDQDGVFLYSTSTEDKFLTLFSEMLKQRKLKMTLKFRDHQVICHGSPVLFIEKGVGVQFLNSSSDLKKEVGDFVEVLRGQGYV